MPEIQEPPGDLSQSLKQGFMILIRRRWLIAASVCTLSFGTILVLLRLPNRYTSQATLFAVQQQVPERYVVSTTTLDVSQALGAMVEEALSRPRLLALVDEFGLYPSERTKLTPDELIKIVRKDVSIEPLPDRVNAFKISYVAESPQVARAVTTRLTTLFIEQNLRTRADRAATTTSFLREQLEVAKIQLVEQEQRLREYKVQYLGELPEQQQGNLGILAGLQTQLDNLQSSRNQAQQQRLYLDSLLNEYRRLGRRGSPGTPGTSETVSPLDAALSDLLRLKTEHSKLLASYTARHPDVLKNEQEIKTQQGLIAVLEKAVVVGAPVTPGAVAPKTEDDAAAAQLKSQLQANTLELDNLTKKEQHLREETDKYQSRLNLTPIREQQLTSLQRDYDLLKQHYGDLLKKEQESQLATNLEKRQEGQQFRLADPPNLPTTPSSPKRVKISLIGLAAGLFIGCGLALAAEFRSPSFRAESDVVTKLGVPLVIGIPLLFTAAEETGRARTKMLELFAGATLVIAVFIAEFYVYRYG